jgi:hypothetical protein
MRNVLLTIALLGLFALCSPASANSIDFDGLPQGPLSMPYTEDGITVDVVTGKVPVSGPTVLVGTSDTVLHFDGGALRFDMGGSAFDALGIDFGFIGYPDTNLELITSGGHTKVLPTTAGYTTVSLMGDAHFAGITYFDVYDPTNAACVEIDWVQMRPAQQGDIPEPGTALLIACGLLGLAGVAYRRRVRA